MPKRIDKLTAEQEARMPAWRDKWIAIGLSTERADRAKFEAAALRCYKAAKLPAPKHIVWVSSPLIMALAAPIAAYLLDKRGAVHGAVDGAVGGAVRGAVDGAVRGAVGGAVHGAVDGAIVGAVGGAVGGAVHGAVGGAVRGAVGGAVGGAVRGAVGGAVHGAVDGAVGEYVKDNYFRYLGGQFWVGGWWGGPAYVSFFREVCGLELPPDIAEAAQAYQETCESACWWWPHRDFIMVCERPVRINRDVQGRLHSATGPAIVWTDGWGVHAWHGTTVAAKWIEQGTALDPVEVLTHENVEQRRAGAEIVGWKNILAKLNPRIIDRDYDPQIGTLLEVDLPDAPGERFLQVRCGTGRDFVLPVPREYNTALEANAATYNVPPQLLRQIEVRT